MPRCGPPPYFSPGRHNRGGFMPKLKITISEIGKQIDASIAQLSDAKSKAATPKTAKNLDIKIKNLKSIKKKVLETCGKTYNIVAVVK
jgi:hypothetical protein